MGMQTRAGRITVRPYQERDREAVRRVCIATSSLPVKNRRQRELLLLQYCDYYLEREPENCFVAVNESDTIIGYILCSEDFKTYRQAVLRDYLPRIRRLGFFRAAGARLELWFTGLYAKRYPAHMHIDILDACQRQGVGHRLVDALAAHLLGRHVPALMLTVGAGNHKGVHFYEKYGFQRIGNAVGAIVMGLWLS